MRLLLCTCAHSFSVDESSKRLSIFNIIEQMNATAFPAPMPPIYLITTLAKDDGDGEEIDLQLTIDVDGEEVANLPLSSNFQGKPKNRIIAELGGLIVPRAGQLSFCVRSGAAIIGRWPVLVTDISNPSIRQVPDAASPKAKKAKKAAPKKTTKSKKATKKKR